VVEHIVLFKWKTDATAEQIEAAVAGLRGLKELVPNVLDLSVGENFTDRGLGFTHGLVVRFPNKAALEVYGPHPAHQHVVQTFINPIRENVLALDYEF
jgi:hypothetical protein